jgi:hypothetical protein
MNSSQKFLHDSSRLKYDVIPFMSGGLCENLKYRTMFGEFMMERWVHGSRYRNIGY